MYTQNELNNAVNNFIRALNDIAPSADRFVSAEVIGRWHDVCGRKIGADISESVHAAVSENLKPYDIERELTEICRSLGGIFDALADAKKEYR